MQDKIDCIVDWLRGVWSPQSLSIIPLIWTGLALAVVAGAILFS